MSTIYCSVCVCPLFEMQGRRKSKKSQFCYGNYDRYYGYRNSGVREQDLRLSLLKKEWFEGKECLDIGSNTGQVCVDGGESLHLSLYGY